MTNQTSNNTPHTPTDDGELQQECLSRIALIVYGTTPSNLTGQQLGRIAFASVDLYQFIHQYGNTRAIKEKEHARMLVLTLETPRMVVDELSDEIAAINQPQREDK